MPHSAHKYMFSEQYCETRFWGFHDSVLDAARVKYMASKLNRMSINFINLWENFWVCEFKHAGCILVREKDK